MDCTDLNKELADLDAQLEAIRSTRRGIAAEIDTWEQQASQGGAGRQRILRTWDGTEVEMNPGAWVTQAELDAARMGDDTIRQMVQAGFDGRLGPNGRTGRMINYSQLEPTQDNVAALLEVMGLKRAATDKGVELKRPFSQEAASRSLLQLAAEYGASPQEMAQALANRARGIDRLPSLVYAVAKARWDSSVQYSDALDELADAMEGGYANDEIRRQAGNVARWAYYYEQLDSQVRRRVGQALRSLQHSATTDTPVFDVSEIQDLTLDGVVGGSMVADMLRLSVEGNAKELRRMAAARRLSRLEEVPVNERGLMADIRILNVLRRANLLSSVSTWVLRNPVSGALVQGLYMGQDTVAGVLRGVARNGLKAGVADGMQAAGYAARAWNSAWSLAWGNASEMLLRGRGTMSDGNLKYITKGISEDPRGWIDNAVNDSYSQLFSGDSLNPMNMPRTAANLMIWLNASAWQVLGKAVERQWGTDAGYLASYRLLNTGDEFVRTSAFAWKANHEAFLRAAEEGRAAGQSAKWIEKRADELASGTISTGLLTDDQLIALRRARNDQFGITAGQEMSDEELRSLYYQQYHNVPNTMDEIGRIASQRTDDVTFTGALTDPATRAISMARQNPALAWMIPFWKVPVNGLGWVLNRDVLVAVPKQLLMESRQLTSRAAGAAQYTVEEMADARARTAVAVGLAVAVHQLWENGLFTDGGPADPRQREIWRRTHSPYSFSLGSAVMGGFPAGVKVRANSVEVVDLMGLQSDVMRAFHEGYIKEGDAASMMRQLVICYANLLQNKAALAGITSVLNVAQDPERYDASTVLAGQMGGILPISGMMGHIQRVMEDPNEMPAKMRFSSAEEMAAMGKDPVFKQMQPIMDFLQKAVTRAVSNYPVLSALQPRERDWLGNTVERPLGLPLDQAIPFMPVVKPEDPLYQWLDKHGFGAKPRPDGTFEMGGSKIQMSNEEEDFYREQMRTVRGEYQPEDLGLSAGRLKPIWEYVQGQTLQGALRNLMRDPKYNELLNSPAGGISPSLTVQPGKTLGARKTSAGGPLYAPVDDIISYYDRLALMKLMSSPEHQFRARWQAVVKQKQQGLQEFADSASVLGVSRQ